LGKDLAATINFDDSSWRDFARQDLEVPVGKDIDVLACKGKAQKREAESEGGE
jgi:hypothetical protein